MEPNENEWLSRAIKFEQEGDLAQARIAFTHLVRFAQPSIRIHALNIDTLIEIGDLDLAKTLLDTLCPRTKKTVNEHFKFGQIRYSKAVYDFEAEEYWCRRLDHVSETYTHIYLGSCLSRQGRHDEAIAEHRKATLLPYKEGVTQPDEALLNIALILRAKDDYQGAFEAASKALAFDPDYAAAQEVADDVSAAIKLQKLEPDEEFEDPGIFLLAEEYKYAQSFVITQKHLEDEPEWVEAQTHFGILLVDFRRFAEAENHIRFLQSPQYLKIVSDSYAEDEKIDRNAEEAIRLAVLEVSAYLELQRGNLEKSEQLLRQLVGLRQFPDTKVVELGECLTSLQRYDEALKVYASIRTRAIEKERRSWPDEWAIKLSGHIHRSQQSYKEAAELYQIGAERYPDNIEFPKLADDCLAAIELSRQLFKE